MRGAASVHARRSRSVPAACAQLASRGDAARPWLLPDGPALPRFMAVPGSRSAAARGSCPSSRPPRLPRAPRPRIAGTSCLALPGHPSRPPCLLGAWLCGCAVRWRARVRPRRVCGGRGGAGTRQRPGLVCECSWVCLCACVHSFACEGWLAGSNAAPWGERPRLHVKRWRLSIVGLATLSVVCLILLLPLPPHPLTPCPHATPAACTASHASGSRPLRSRPSSRLGTSRCSQVALARAASFPRAAQG